MPAGSSFELECPVKYCTKKPHVTWCKLEGKNCLLLGYKLLGYMNWKENESISIFVLHFNHILARDTGSYRCSASFTSGVIESHSIIINVTGEFYTPRLSDIFSSCFKEKEDLDSQEILLDTELMSMRRLPHSSDCDLCEHVCM